VNAPVFAIGKRGEIIFQRSAQIVERIADGTVGSFRGAGVVAKGEPPLQQVIAYAWASDGTLYLSDSKSLGVGDLPVASAEGVVGTARLRRIGTDGIIRLAARVEGKLIKPQVWNSIGAPRIWSIAIDGLKRIYTALPDIGQVVRIDPDGSQHVVDRSVGGWRVTAVATFGDSVFLLESSDRTNDGQRVRVIRGSGKVELLGQVEP